ncbi:DUF983 domain-containing protein [Bernardetia sp.]|uniref:DUF983 domain-containing protein n=1 Tax=Bernardetia sp. TaxID=1937974 RepID=UPI0025B7D23B|nr:DUF983 domain-containing protein [Bernardetia sp.]
MGKERSKFQAILQCKCPRCRQGDIFVKSAFHYKFAKTHRNCPVCNLKYERTLGFWWTAMYISYAFNVAHVITVLFAVNILSENRPDLWVYFASILGTFIFFIPFYFRYSRVITLHLPVFSNVKYSNDPKVWEAQGE